jgi:protein gp37
VGDGTEIGWTDASWNCFRGCSRTIAAGAETSGCGDPTGGGCYAERNGWRFAGPGMAYDGIVRMTPNGARWTGKVMLVDDHLLDPLRWQRPRRIFTTSVSDPFHERFTNETIAVAFGVMVATSWHKHQLLTKRVRRMRDWYEWLAREAAASNGGRGMSPAAYCFALLQRYVADRQRFSDADRKLLSRADVVDDALAAPWPTPNIWPMASVEHQPAADDRIPDLLEIPAVVRGLSCEPLIGPVDLNHVQRDREVEIDSLNGTHGVVRPHVGRHDERVSWVIAGAESGPGARPADVEWFRSLRDQCRAAGVKFFVKQIVVDGKLRKDVAEFPPDLQIQEFPR